MQSVFRWPIESCVKTVYRSWSWTFFNSCCDIAFEVAFWYRSIGKTLLTSKTEMRMRQSDKKTLAFEYEFSFSDDAKTWITRRTPLQCISWLPAWWNMGRVALRRGKKLVRWHRRLAHPVVHQMLLHPDDHQWATGGPPDVATSSGPPDVALAVDTRMLACGCNADADIKWPTGCTHPVVHPMCTHAVVHRMRTSTGHEDVRC